jgi:hypothetical protein
MSTEQLKALRDAAQEQQDFQRDKTGDTATQLYYGAAQLVSCCDRAIAALEAAEQVQQTATIPLAQHEAIVAAVQGQVAEARREGLREALALVERDRIATAAHSQDSRDAAWNALNLTANGIRTMAEKGDDVLLGKTDCTECDVSFPCYGGNKPCIRD